MFAFVDKADVVFETKNGFVVPVRFRAQEVELINHTRIYAIFTFRGLYVEVFPGFHSELT